MSAALMESRRSWKPGWTCAWLIPFTPGVYTPSAALVQTGVLRQSGRCSVHWTVCGPAPLPAALIAQHCAGVHNSSPNTPGCRQQDIRALQQYNGAECHDDHPRDKTAGGSDSPVAGLFEPVTRKYHLGLEKVGSVRWDTSAAMSK